MSFLHFAQTPPMGWNSWDCYGASVTEAEVIAHADFMAEHLKSGISMQREGNLL